MITISLRFLAVIEKMKLNNKHSFNKLFIISTAYKVATAELWLIKESTTKNTKPYICVKYFQNFDKYFSRYGADMTSVHVTLHLLL